MVKVYLHPEIEAMWADSGSAGPRTPNADAAAAAQKLLADVRITDRTATRHQVRSWALGASVHMLALWALLPQHLTRPAAMHLPLSCSDVQL